ncbi:hypothetical protein [Cytobacillus sp. IB215665]|uniref:hypothetical protein n=1 Tax=Cytobacillus sp. IB215665 TaxID=3097357 RepID=UPI002A1780BA|nr:hypothetical protein [Cytobacillus sp. IB215665]MDX8367871.1 hypothetical protein [Cytobacillus sp. IB215665]
MKDALDLSKGEVVKTAIWLQQTRLPHHTLGSVTRTLYRIRKDNSPKGDNKVVHPV